MIAVLLILGTVFALTTMIAGPSTGVLIVFLLIATVGVWIVVREHDQQKRPPEEGP